MENESIESRNFKIRFMTEMLGTVAKDEAVFKNYIESKKPESKNGEDESLTIDKMEEKGWTGFHHDEGGLFIYEYMIKGFLKQAGNVLKDILKIKALRSKIDDFVFISPRKIYFTTRASEPDGFVERPLRCMTMQGPRVCLARSDYMNVGHELNFQINLIKHKEINWKIVENLLEYGKLSGLGQFRNGGYGRFEVTG